ncbi:SDR family oxidoreductase, partial [Myroides odoratimimus]|uniref:SDR family oxidoreductase n=1 Tax=Myroides odoratimimus TaxID=76832 RepID=UPI0025768F21
SSLYYFKQTYYLTLAYEIWAWSGGYIPTTISDVDNFGKNTPMGRPGQPCEIAPIYVFLASDQASYISGAIIAATGGRITL